jgi:hypothetical protein
MNRILDLLPINKDILICLLIFLVLPIILIWRESRNFDEKGNFSEEKRVDLPEIIFFCFLNLLFYLIVNNLYLSLLLTSFWARGEYSENLIRKKIIKDKELILSLTDRIDNLERINSQYGK